MGWSNEWKYLQLMLYSALLKYSYTHACHVKAQTTIFETGLSDKTPVIIKRRFKDRNIQRCASIILPRQIIALPHIFFAAMYHSVR